MASVRLLDDGERVNPGTAGAARASDPIMKTKQNRVNSIKNLDL
jgi:hypothetical protein